MILTLDSAFLDTHKRFIALPSRGDGSFVGNLELIFKRRSDVLYARTFNGSPLMPPPGLPPSPTLFPFVPLKSRSACLKISRTHCTMGDGFRCNLPERIPTRAQVGRKSLTAGPSVPGEVYGTHNTIEGNFPTHPSPNNCLMVRYELSSSLLSRYNKPAD